MNKINENLYPVAWRFNAFDCNLNDKEKNTLVFFDKNQSHKLWKFYFNIDNFMQLKSNDFILIEKKNINFNDSQDATLFFKKYINDKDLLIYFCGKVSAILLKPKIFLKGWDDFFYPSDEDSCIIIPNSNKVIYSFEETFFVIALTHKSSFIPT